MLEVKKWSGRLLVATGGACQTPSRLLFLMEANSGRQFLIDTKAEVSVIPPSPMERNETVQAFKPQWLLNNNFWHLLSHIGLRPSLHVLVDFCHCRHLHAHHWSGFPPRARTAGRHETDASWM